MLHGRWVRPRGQGPWLTDGFAKPLSVDVSSIKHLPNVQGGPRRRLRRRRRPRSSTSVVQAADAAQGEVGRLADPARATRTSGPASARPTRPGRCRPASRATSATSTPRSRRRRRRRPASFTLPVQRPQPDRPGLRRRRLHGDNGGADKDSVTVFSNTQNVASHVAEDQATTLGLAALEQVRVVYYEGSSSFGNGYHYFDIAESAALMSKLAGAPVRLQLMRWDEQGWTRYGQAIMHDMQGGIDANGNIVAYEATQFTQASTSLSATRRSSRSGSAAGAPGAGGTNTENLAPIYKVAIKRPGIGLPADRQDEHAADRHVPDRHAARAVGPADDVRVGAVRRHARRCGRAWIRHVPAPEHAHGRRSSRAGRHGARRRPSTASGYKPHVPRSQLAERPRTRPAGAWRSARTTPRMPRTVAQGPGRQEDRQGRPSSELWAGSGLGLRRSTRA